MDREYDQHRGHRGAFRGIRGRERSRERGGYYERNLSHSRDSSEHHDMGRKRYQIDAPGPSSRGKFQKFDRGGRGRGRGGRGRGGGRGGAAAKQRKPEFPDSLVTRNESLNDKRGGAADDEKITVCANFFKVSSKNIERGIQVTMCHVAIEPDISNKRERSSLMAQHRAKLGTYVYDASSSMYLTKALAKNETLSFKSEGGDKQSYQITITAKRPVKPTDSMFFTVLNLIVRQAMSSMNLQLIGKRFYDPTQVTSLPQHDLSIWTGYVTSVRQHEHDLLVSCDLSYKIMRSNTIHKMITDLIKKGGDHKSAARDILGMTVLTCYNDKTYRVTDIDWRANPMETFECNGKRKTYADYYWERYQVKIQDLKQPMLVHKPSAREIRAGAPSLIYLVPELCRATGINERMRTDFQLMREMAQSIRKNPMQRARFLRSFNQKLQQNDKSAEVFSENKMTVSRDFVDIDARRLRQNKILFGNSKYVDMHEERDLKDTVDWTRCLQDKQMFEPRRLERWALIFPEAMNGRKEIDTFFDKFVKIGRALGMQIDDKKCNRMRLSSPQKSNYMHALEECLGKDYGFIMIVIGFNKADLYADIKRLTLCSQHFKPVPLQVVVNKTIDRPKNIDAIVQKIAIQVNCKLGGHPWYINLPTKSIMIIGYDVSHDTKDKRKSFGALVAHYIQKADRKDQEPGHFFSVVDHHENGQDISTKFSIHVIEALQNHIREHNTLPDRIVIYRDGVSDGDLERVMAQEVMETKAKLANLYREWDMPLQFAFIVINRKINTRIFTKGGREEFGNPLPGTVVDDVITLPERYDFYLISQSVTQGTASPTSYNVIYDSLGWSPTVIQTLTYKLCHMYYNWSGTTRVPSVVQYAKKLAFLTGQYLHTLPENHQFEQNDYLYFL